MISTSTVRAACAADRDSALETLVSAFADDPLAQHLFGNLTTLHRHLPAFFGYLLDVSLDGCEVVVTDDLSAASLWTPPGGNRLGTEVIAERWQAVLLETATPSNLPFYERLGFAVRHCTDLPGGPPVWTMWREPAGAQ